MSRKGKCGLCGADAFVKKYGGICFVCRGCKRIIIDDYLGRLKKAGVSVDEGLVYPRTEKELTRKRMLRNRGQKRKLLGCVVARLMV